MLGLVQRNLGWAALNPGEVLKARRAMKQYRAQHTFCEACGDCEDLEVHHEIPLWAGGSPDDPANMITLCMGSRRCHLNVGHDGNFRKRYVKNCRELSALLFGSYISREIVCRE